jgi:hypothetical protein
VLAIGPRDPGHPIEAAFAPRGESARLRSDDRRRTILFDLTLSFEIVQEADPRNAYDSRLVSYEYRLLGEDRYEILAFHWHPVGLSDFIDPHLHLSSRLNPIDMGRNQDPLPLAGMHIPTGFVTLEDVVRLLITEFGITPRRDDWDDLLRENRTIALADQGR